ncbi:hypothetical protein HDU79_011716 [Rhizoclosmatium sp. JEL0117]|nr:hypothetical protein HDU79_011716 [Rhizoclosmatium sp. JEL0117]
MATYSLGHYLATIAAIYAKNELTELIEKKPLCIAALIDHTPTVPVIAARPRMTPKAWRPRPCEGCRDQRKKCDLSWPTCNYCKNRGVPCVYVDQPKQDIPAHKARVEILPNRVSDSAERIVAMSPPTLPAFGSIIRAPAPIPTRPASHNSTMERVRETSYAHYPSYSHGLHPAPTISHDQNRIVPSSSISAPHALASYSVRSSIFCGGFTLLHRSIKTTQDIYPASRRRHLLMDTKPDNPIAPPADERRDDEGFNGTTGGNVNLNLDGVHHDAAAPDHDGFPDIQPIVFGGSGRPQPCEGCRVHRKRCDLTRPSCSRCIKRQVPCSYKPAPIKLRKRASERGSGQLDSSDGSSTTHIIPLNHSPTAASSREGSVASPLKSDVDVAAAHRILEASPPSRLVPRPVEVVKISEQQIQLQQKQNLARMAAQKSLRNIPPPDTVTRVYQTEGRIAPSYVHSEPYYEYADGKGRNVNEGKVAVPEVLVDTVESVNERGDEANR